jgi:glycerate kinase
LESYFKKDIIKVPGAGAAGGLGAGLSAFCNAAIKPGFETISEIVQLENTIQKIDLIITGEGKMDYQTKFGKVPFGVAQIAKKYKKPVIGIAGSLGKGYRELYNYGFQSIFSISEQPVSLKYSMENAKSLLFNASERIIRLIFIDQ